MFEVLEHNRKDCIKFLNMIICEIPFLKTFTDDCLLERLLNLIAIITNAFDNMNNESIDCNQWESEEEREQRIREWLLRHYNAKCQIDELDFNDSDDRTRITVLIINILFKLRHALKDLEQYLQNYQSFAQFDRDLNGITRFDKLLELVVTDLNAWKSKAGYFKVKLEETKKQIDKYQQNEIFNYNCNPRNQNLYKSRINLNKSVIESSDDQNLINDSLCRLTDDTDNASEDSEDSYDKTVNNAEISFICIDCDEKYLTKLEFNLHVLKDHKNIDITEIIKNKNNNNNINNSLNTSIINNINIDSKKAKKSRNQTKRTFKCIYNKCGKAFYKSHELKKHFDRHQPKVDRIVVIYSNQSNAVLNKSRIASKPKARRVSNCSEHRVRNNKTNNNFNNNINNNKNKNKISLSNDELTLIDTKHIDNYTIDSLELNYSNCISDTNINTLIDVPLIVSNNQLNRSSVDSNHSIDSNDYFNEKTDEAIDSNATQMEIEDIFGLESNPNPNPLTNGSKQ